MHTRRSWFAVIALSFVARAALAAGLGDVTHDGAVSIADATRLWRIVHALESATAQDSARGDCAPRPGAGGRVVGDGALDALDVDRLLDFVVGNLDAAQFYGAPSIAEIWPASLVVDDTAGSFFVFGAALTARRRSRSSRRRRSRSPS